MKFEHGNSKVGCFLEHGPSSLKNALQKDWVEKGTIFPPLSLTIYKASDFLDCV